MLALNRNGAHRKPACAHCGGTGYVYLWSVAASGNRTWYCDRSGCKRSWSDVNPLTTFVLSPKAGEHSLVNAAARVEQPHMHATKRAELEFVQPERSPVRVVRQPLMAARAVVVGAPQSECAIGLD